MSRDAGLAAYVPRLAAAHPDTAWATRPASLVFADISGYTRLYDRARALGREGDELLTRAVNRCFRGLVDAVLRTGGDVVRFGGDALFVVFEGHEHEQRAAMAAALMQRAIATQPSIAVPGGRVRLRISIGAHTGPLVTYRWSGAWDEVVPIGPSVSEVLRLEAAATSGEVRVSPALTATLPRGWVDGARLRQSVVRAAADRARPLRGGALSPVRAALLPPRLRALLADRPPLEHRAVAIGFVHVGGLDRAATSRSSAQRALDPVFATLDGVVDRFGVIPLATDVSDDGLKIIVGCGVPDATDDDAERLVLALRDVACRHPRRVRAGAHLGTAFCGDVGHPRRRTYTVMGDTVNLAARMMARAAPGQVIATRDLLDALTRRVDIRWLAPFTVKGKRALQVAGVVGAPGRALDDDSLRLAFRGRDRERAAVLDALTRHGVAEIAGAPGIGATRLVVETLAHAGRSAFTTTAVLDESHVPLAGIAGLARTLPGPVRARAQRALAAGTPRAGGTDGIRRATAIAARLAAAVPPEATIVIDRSQHLDEASVGVVRALLALPRDRRPGVVLVGRGAWVGPDGHIELGPLDPASTRALVSEAAGAARSDAQLAAIVRVAGGNPRFAQRLARLPPGAALPPSLEAVVAARIDRLDPPTRAAVRDLAVMGNEGALSDAAEVLHTDPAVLHADLAPARDLVTIRAGRYRFRDDQARIVAAGGLPAARRRLLHAAVARQLAGRPGVAAAAVAEHWSRSGSATETMRWCERAGVDALQAGASAQAVDWLTQALDAAESLGRTRRAGALADRLAHAAFVAAMPDAEDAALCRALRHSTGPAHARLLLRRAEAARHADRTALAGRCLGALGRLLPQIPALRARFEVERVWLDFARGQRSSGLLRRCRALGAARHVRADPVAAYWCAALEAALLTATGDTGALEAEARALTAARRSGDPHLIATATVNHAVALDDRGHWREATRLYRRAETAMRRSGNVVGEAMARFNRLTIEVELGHVDQAMAPLEELRRVFAAAGSRHAEALAALVLAKAHDRRGDRPTGTADRHRLAESLRVVEQAYGAEAAGWHRVAAVEALLREGRVREARTAALRLTNEVADLDAAHLAPLAAARVLAEAEFLLGRVDHARALLDTAYARAADADVVPERVAIRTAQRRMARRAGAPMPPAEDRLAARLGVVACADYQPPAISGRASRPPGRSQGTARRTPPRAAADSAGRR